ncbi:MAG: hypothetical protein CVU11_15400 [Bacteroidetes bacterium HGW-Bacteroidetes-6]|jgi:hypothetical protein|nr:MAG: hypothetical protein CVU11_15400 [Bacteroidetes bacterium HGW-Bacteroidetes-6]
MEKLNYFKSKIRDMLWSYKHFQYKIEIIPDNPNPDSLRDNIVYVVGSKNYIKWGYMKCPCGCGDTIMLSLNEKAYPSWSIKQDKIGRATISPSVNKLDGCKSHFFIRKGKLIWATFNDY